MVDVAVGVGHLDNLVGHRRGIGVVIVIEIAAIAAAPTRRIVDLRRPGLFDVHHSQMHAASRRIG